MKKKLSLVLVIVSLALGAEKVRAQGGFGGIHVASEFTPNGNLLLMGGGGAWVINSNFYLGGAGYGSVNTLGTNSGDLNSMGYGGFMFGYYKEIQNSFKLGADILTGSGGYSIDNQEDDFFFIEPNLKLWYSVLPYMHISVGAYYRIAYLNADAVLNPNDLSNVGIKLSLNFGIL